MAGKLLITGVHPVQADEPVHLIEICIPGKAGDFDFGAVTQECAGQPRVNWQVAYEEQLTAESDEESRYVFFFHYLDFDKPLLTSDGPVALPSPTDMPAHLNHIRYESPG